MVFERLIDDIAIGQRVAAIDTNEARDQAAYAGSRTDAWHALGTTVPDDMDVPTAIKLAHLDGLVRKEALSFTSLSESGVSTVTLTDKVALVDEDPFTGQVRYLNTVGTDYRIVQAEELGEMGHAILGEEGGSQIASVGAFNQGKEVFMSLRLPVTVKVGGEDLHNFYLGLLNRHGGGALVGVITDVRFEPEHHDRRHRRGEVPHHPVPHVRYQGPDA
jgi:hypothetical protein